MYGFEATPIRALVVTDMRFYQERVEQNVVAQDVHAFTNDCILSMIFAGLYLHLQTTTSKVLIYIH